VGVIYLVRHGQASLFGRDYDKLSEVGIEQSRVVGRALVERGVRPDLVVRGPLVRHRETVEAAFEAAGWDVGGDIGGDVVVDPRWAEIDHIDIIKALEPTYVSHAAMVDALLVEPEPSVAFRRVFDDALRDWLGGDGGHAYVEAYEEFRSRVDEALADVVSRTGPDDTVVVFSSGGPVAGAISTALDLDTAAWLAVSRLIINASLTKLVVGESGVTLVSFNEHAHVEATGLLTYH
jgi:broad specificity phosphatase PhoE